MRAAEAVRATAAATSVATSLGLAATDAVVLHDSNRLTLRLLPCDTLARVAPVAQQVAAFEVELARQLVAAGAPVGGPDPRVEPRVHERDGFVVTLWTYHEPVAEPEPAGYARAFERLHAGMRTVDVATPHFTDRVGDAHRLLADRALTPELPDDDREFLSATLQTLRRAVTGRGAAEQVLHGEPHPGNVLVTPDGVRFIDFETCCRGPVEFDLAHAPDGVGELYPGVDAELLRQCRILVLVLVVAWRWDRDDQLPDGRRRAAEWLGQIRRAG